MRALVPLLLTAATLGLAACGDDDTTTGDTGTPPPAETQAEATTPAEQPQAAEAGECKDVERPEPKSTKIAKPTGSLDASKTNTVEFDTSCGKFTVELDVKNNPKTANVVASLAKDGVYDNTTFHRIIPQFMNQGGDPAGDGTGGPDWSVVEAPAAGTKYTRGLVAMAKTATEPAGSSGSQFFVMTADYPLPADYAVAGKVTSGMEAVDAISAIGSASGTPAKPVVINKATFKTE